MYLQVFRPYAKWWLTPLVELILCKEFTETCGSGISYFVNDIMVTVLSWHLIATPEVYRAAYDICENPFS
jgi:DNA-dependent protein kinase catalytic subunit